MGRHSAPSAPGLLHVLDDAAPPAASVDPLVRRGRHAAVAAEPTVVIATPEPDPAAPTHGRHPHAGRSAGRPVVELLSWTSFAAAVAWGVVVASGRGALAALRWPLGLAALVPAALLVRALAGSVRERPTHRRGE
jgi:hypothetical protein